MDRWEIIARAEIEIINNKGSCTKLWLASWASNTIVVQPCFNIIILRQGLINVQVVILKVSYYAQAYSKSHAVSNMHVHIPMTWLISTITQQEYIVADMHNHTARVYRGWHAPSYSLVYHGWHAQSYCKSILWLTCTIILREYIVADMHDHTSRVYCGWHEQSYIKSISWLTCTIILQEYIVADMHDHTPRVYCG